MWHHVFTHPPFITAYTVILPLGINGIALGAVKLIYSFVHCWSLLWDAWSKKVSCHVGMLSMRRTWLTHTGKPQSLAGGSCCPL